MTDLPPPIYNPTPSSKAGRWYRRRILKLPVWGWLLVFAVIGAAAGSAGSASSKKESSSVTTSPTSSPVKSAETADETTSSAPPSTTARTSSTTTLAPTTTKAELKTIESGTYMVGNELEPGEYRVSGYFARLDSKMEIIDNDGVYSENALTFMKVLPTDAYVQINGEAVRVEDFRAYVGTGYDPIAIGATGGTYIVGEDIAPGRYRVQDDTYAYAARLRCDRDIIDNEGNAGSVIIIVRENDCLFQFSGILSKIG